MFANICCKDLAMLCLLCALTDQRGACQVFFAAATALGASAVALAVRQLLLWRLVRSPALLL